MKEELLRFVGKKIIAVEGNSKLDIQRLQGKKIKELKSWGKHFLIVFDDFTLRIHLMMFGSYRINEERSISARLSLYFSRNQRMHFYNCSVKFIEEPLDDIYNWQVDVMSPVWNGKSVLKLLKQQRDAYVCDVLLNQNVFAGSGNIVKNEVLYMERLNPLQKVGSLSAGKCSKLVYATRNYAHDFYVWKKAFVFREHWLVYRKAYCPKCGRKLHVEWLGETNRKTYYCPHCQKMKL